MTTPLKIGQPRFLTTEEVLSLHRLSIDTYGGADGVLDAGKLDASLAMPKQGFSGEYAHEFPFGMSAAYGYRIAMNHAFRDGNKRTAFAAMVAFLRMAGWDFQMPDVEAAGMMLELIEQRRDKGWLAHEINARSRPRVSLELRDFFQLAPSKDIEALMISLEKAPRPAEVLASVDECVRHIPLAWDLLQIMMQLGNASQHDQGARVALLLQLVAAMFRQAEDMGYEW